MEGILGTFFFSFGEKKKTIAHTRFVHHKKKKIYNKKRRHPPPWLLRCYIHQSFPCLLPKCSLLNPLNCGRRPSWTKYEPEESKTLRYKKEGKIKSKKKVCHKRKKEEKKKRNGWNSSHLGALKYNNNSTRDMRCWYPQRQRTPIHIQCVHCHETWSCLCSHYKTKMCSCWREYPWACVTQRSEVDRFCPPLFHVVSFRIESWRPRFHRRAVPFLWTTGGWGPV